MDTGENGKGEEEHEHAENSSRGKEWKRLRTTGLVIEGIFSSKWSHTKQKLAITNQQYMYSLKIVIR